ncbi:MAG: hypothetical protein H6658_12320 [Ardenticatenaceae bacterium]|nr:hypothetical protein [Ardenticatenaceae bacterium]
MPKLKPKQIEVFGSEVNLHQVFDIDVIVQYSQHNQCLIIKKPSGQAVIVLHPQDFKPAQRP